MSAVAGLQQSGRNMFLNPAFQAKWAPQASAQNTALLTPQGDTRFDPFLGTGWDRWLDMAGAKRPGGVRISGDVGNQAIGGLQRARGKR